MRSSLAEEQEKIEAAKFFNIVEQRVLCPKDSIVIGRYSVLPFYKELEEDLKYLNSKLINSYREHRYVADIQNWYYDLEDMTPKTWFRLEDVPIKQDGSFILKGETNSRKALWNTHMFAKTRSDITNIACKLMDDSLIGSQNIYCRQFEPLISFGNGMNDIPISKEFRFFVCDKKVIASGFYWSEQDFVLSSDEVPITFINEIIDRIGDNIRFFVVDVGQKVDGNWIVIELNDGQMSGLSCCNANELYSNLNNILND